MLYAAAAVAEKWMLYVADRKWWMLYVAAVERWMLYVAAVEKWMLYVAAAGKWMLYAAAEGWMLHGAPLSSDQMQTVMTRIMLRLNS